MRILSVISCLLDYPEADVKQHRGEIVDMVISADIDVDIRKRLVSFINQYADMPLLDWQSEYDGLFERGRSLGLWLFEHVHGESRDRGQAMVDLTAKYREAGLEISQHQLPDYIPMFLEFLATQGEDNAKEWLLDVEHILALLQCRLERRKSGYSVLFEALLDIAGSQLNLDEVRQNVSSEKRDDTRKSIDKEWEEEEVTFGSESLEKSCSDATRRPSESQRKDIEVPLNWVGFEDGTNQLEGVAK